MTCAAVGVAAAGLASPARADDPAPTARSSADATQDASGNTRIQEPKPTYGDASKVVRAQAASDPGSSADPADFRLARGSDLSGRIDDLYASLYEEGVQDLMDDANRDAPTGSACKTDPFGPGDNGTPLERAKKYCWKSDDAISKEWIPQAISGVSDAQQDEYWGAKRPITIGSYDSWNPGRDDPNTDGTKGDGVCQAGEPDSCNEKGARITFLDPATNKYRHVLLVWPYYNKYDHISFDGVHADENPLQKGIHAGGMVWYGNYLYVADTMAGIRVFDMRHIIDLNPDNDSATDDPTRDGLTSNVQDTRKIGRQDNVWYSYGYRYVMPQVDSWKFTTYQYNKARYSDGEAITWCEGFGAPKASYLSLDRSASPDELVMGEYCRTGNDKEHGNQAKPSTGRLAGIPLDGETGQISTGDYSGVSMWGNYLPKEGIQGAAKYKNKFYLNQSHKYSNGTLWRAAINDGTTLTTVGSTPTAVGPEDLYIEHGEETKEPPLLWSVSEHRENTDDTSCYASDPSPCGRVIYAHKLSSVP
ncbi:hypothetical protein [Streptomyces sp. NPDC127066]|uniref:hypothetical protein n=1 Tax=Streptomyces sp. NPDC127066 TaxID=3347125 RepID=UPI0036536B3F